MSGNNNNLDLTKILKNCPKGWKFYSKIHGDVNFYGFNLSDKNYPIVVSTFDNFLHHFTKNGKKFYLYEGECILVPSREQQDWSKFTAPWYKQEKKNVKFNPHTLKPFDKVLVRDSLKDLWRCDHFSHISYNHLVTYEYCTSMYHRFCIPYNYETKHLVGTSNEAPKYYRYWEVNCKQK